jgi:cytochrome c5
MKTKPIFFLFTLAFFVACNAQLLTLTQADADRGAEKFEGTTIESLNQGKAIFEANCNRCHGLKKPSSKSEEQWNSIVPQMVKKVNKLAGREEINPRNQEFLRRYLVTMSSSIK